MTPVLLSTLFDDSAPAELAALAKELGFEGLDLGVDGDPATAARRLRELSDHGLPVRSLTCVGWSPSDLAPWADLAAEHGCGWVRTGRWPADAVHVSANLEACVTLAERCQVTLLIPHHPTSCFREPAHLAALLHDLPPARVAACLAPDQVPRPRDLDPAVWLATAALPPIGAVALGSYRWLGEVTAGNQHRWTARPAGLAQGLTPWEAWLDRVAGAGFDGLFTFGDPTLPATANDRACVVRDDLRFVRRVWRPRPTARQAADGSSCQRR